MIRGLNKDKKAEKIKVTFTTQEDIEHSSGDYLDIWNINPSYKDIHNTLSYKKTIFLFILLALGSIGIITLTKDSRIAIGFILFFGIMFFISFHDEFFIFPHLISFAFRKHIKLNPFNNYLFWMDKNDKKTIICSNSNDLIHIGLRIFQIKLIPENVHATLTHFLRTLSHKDIMIPFTYQVAHTPLYDISKTVLRHTKKESGRSFRIGIYFCIYHSVRGILTEKKLDDLLYILTLYEKEFSTLFAEDFHHFKISLLYEQYLINALRIFYFKGVNYPTPEDTHTILRNGMGSFVYFKMIFCCMLILFFNIVFFSWEISWYIVISCNFVLLGLFIYLWWRTLIFNISIRYIRRKGNSIVKVDPFENVKFYYFRRHPDSLFLHINNQLLVDTKISNIKNAALLLSFIKQKFSQAGNKFAIAEITPPTPFTYTVITSPITFYDFYREGTKNLRPKIKYLLYNSQYGIRHSKDEIKWLDTRAGIWKTVILLSMSSFKFTATLTIQEVNELEQELVHKVPILEHQFKANFKGTELIRLHKNLLLSGFVSEIVKNRKHRLNGSHLNYLLFQGKALVKFLEISDSFKKGLNTRIGTEFNTPLYLENDITIGYALNTETYETEILAGFTLAQLRNLLITNGTPIEREFLAMKFVSEGIKIEQSFLIFDFFGEWSRLLSYFQESCYEDELLYFTFGRTFSTDPLHSGIIHDHNSIEYREFMLYAYGLPFKKNPKMMNLLRDTISRYPEEIKFSSLNLQLNLNNEIERQKYPLRSLFPELTQQDLTYFHDSKISASDFITTDKTVIIDLSMLDTLSKKLFVTFLILSKIIHYSTYSDEFSKKIVVIPYIDNVFDALYLDRQSNYGIIDIFLRPLIQHGFGLIFSANQVHYLHQHIFSYVGNILSFKAIDSRDISALKMVMNLQELVGSGYYSQTRNQLYQFNYLMTLPKNEVLVKRDDIYQSFPYSIDWDTIQHTPRLSYEDIIEHMEQQGYNMHDIEKSIVEHAKQTLFDIDLGPYTKYLQEIIRYLSHLKRIDHVGNLTKMFLKEQLLKYIAPHALQENMAKEDIKTLRDNILKILITQRYLQESHPRRASGAESTRTTYVIGEQYDHAIEDYYKVKGGITSDPIIEIIEKESDNIDTANTIFSQHNREYIIKQGELKKACVREFGNFNYTVFTIYNYINERRYNNAIKLEHRLIKEYLINVYAHFRGTEYIVSETDLITFLELLGNDSIFPFSTSELKNLIMQCDSIALDNMDSKTRAEKLYSLIYEFSLKIQNYIYGV